MLCRSDWNERVCTLLSGEVDLKQRRDITGAVLAGGKSSRMGKDKALLKLDGRTFIERITGTLEQVFTSVIVIADRTKQYEFFSRPVYRDVFRNRGPLGGIHSALVHAPTERVFITSCDVPLLSLSVIRRVVRRSARAQALVLFGGNSLQPLCGLYHRSCLPVIEEHLKRGEYSVQACLNNLDTLLISYGTNSPDDVSYALTNVNTPSDYRRVLREVRGPSKRSGTASARPTRSRRSRHT